MCTPSLDHGLPIKLRAGGLEESWETETSRPGSRSKDSGSKVFGSSFSSMEMVQCQIPKGLLQGSCRGRQTPYLTSEASVLSGVTVLFGSGLLRSCSSRGDFANAPLGIKAELPTEWNWRQSRGHGTTARQQVHRPAPVGHGNKLQTCHLWGVYTSWCFPQQTALTLWPVDAETGQERITPGSS